MASLRDVVMCGLSSVEEGVEDKRNVANQICECIEDFAVLDKKVVEKIPMTDFADMSRKYGIFANFEDGMLKNVEIR